MQVSSADAYSADEVRFLQSKGIAVLPVSEIENVFLLPTVVEAIARAEGYSDKALQGKLAKIFEELLTQAQIQMSKHQS